MSEDFHLHIVHLFPDLLNLYGDKGNIVVLQNRCSRRGIQTSVSTYTEQDGQPDFSAADMVFIGGGSDRDQLLVSKYSDVVGPALKEYVEQDGTMLAVCAGYQLLGAYYEAGGEKIPCFGLLDIYTASSTDRLIGNIAIECEMGGKTVRLAGFENHGGRTVIGKYEPFGKVLLGFGNEGGGVGSGEGVRYKNTVATYLHGPVLPKNPELADFLIHTALAKKYPDTFKGFAELDDTMEQKAKEFIIEREQSRNSV